MKYPFILCSLLLVLGLCSCKSTRSSELSDGGWARVTGGSMEPTLNNGDVVSLVPTPFELLEAGDIVVFRGRNNDLIVHRIYPRDPQSWYAQGDANDFRDDVRVTRWNYIGQVYDVNKRHQPSMRETLQAKEEPKNALGTQSL